VLHAVAGEMAWWRRGGGFVLLVLAVVTLSVSLARR
jgi:hypothetical protein